MSERRERGAVTVEYLGVVALVASIVTGVAASAVPQVVAAGLEPAVCRALQMGCRGTVAPAGGGDAGEDDDELVSGAPAGSDTDGDGLLDAQELELATDPLAVDGDGDGKSDAQELADASDPATSDPYRAWAADQVARVPLPDLETATPQELHRFFSQLTDAERDYLVRRYPQIIGSLAGAPVEMRYDANRILMARSLTASAATSWGMGG